MKSIIEKLRILNDVDQSLKTVRKDLDRMPRQVAEMEEGANGIILEMERRIVDIKRLKLEAEALELELRVGEEAMKKFSNQMSLMRTQKEMEAIRRQISTQKMFNGRTERKALEMMEEAEALGKVNEAVGVQLKAKQDELAVERARVDKEMGELWAQKAELEAKRGLLAQEIPAKELGIYDRIVVNRGNAIAKVQGGNCSACYIQLPPQVHHLAILGNELVTCPSCTVILTADRV